MSKAIAGDTLPPSADRALLTRFEELALEAGRAIMAVRMAGARVTTKPDLSPVTEADREAERIILEGLRASFPGLECVAEEEVSRGVCRPPEAGSFVLVDPLDGTREFIAGSRDFTVNIALAREGAPVLGVVYAPARNELYSGIGRQAEFCRTDDAHEIVSRQAISARPRGEPPVVLASLSHRTQATERYIAGLGPARVEAIGSSYKFCLLAAGQADLYPRLGPTMQWDTAAGDAVLRAAGGMTRALDGAPLAYGPRQDVAGTEFANPHFVAEGLPAPS